MCHVPLSLFCLTSVVERASHYGEYVFASICVASFEGGGGSVLYPASFHTEEESLKNYLFNFSLWPHAIMINIHVHWHPNKS